MMKRVLGVCVAVLVALLAGWISGASGESATGRALQSSVLRGELLDARLDIYTVTSGRRAVISRPLGVEYGLPRNGSMGSGDRTM